MVADACPFAHMHVIFLLIVYFLIAALVIALVAFPPFRMRVATILRTCSHRILSRLCTTLRFATDSVTTQANTLGNSTRRSSTFLWKNRKIAALVAVVLIIPSVIALFYRDTHVFQVRQQTSIDARIQALLTGERLAPPAPLPPEVFTTREVELIRPHLAQASRNWDKLDADFRQRLLLVYKIMHETHGYEMVLIEGYRSPERQNELAAMGSHVTNARAYQSYHQFGLAADSAFMRNGKIVISEKDPWAMKGYELYGETAEKAGLTWGGRWKMMDFGHVELRKPGARNRKKE